MSLRSLILLGATVILCSCGDHRRETDPHAIRVVTFNIRYDNPQDGVHAWSNRRERVVELLRSLNADIIGLQEVLPDQRDFLEQELTEFSLRGVGRDDGAERGEASPVLYDRERFDELEFRTWWLSETPDGPSRGWDAALLRIATLVRLRDRVSGDEFLVVCTHFDHRGEEAREQSAELLVRMLADERRVILLGDFNAGPGSVPHRTLTAAFMDAAGDDARPTWTGFDGEPDPGQRIDWILARGGRVISYDVHAWMKPGRPESDHLPVVAEVIFD